MYGFYVCVHCHIILLPFLLSSSISTFTSMYAVHYTMLLLAFKMK